MSGPLPQTVTKGSDFPENSAAIKKAVKAAIPALASVIQRTSRFQDDDHALIEELSHFASEYTKYRFGELGAINRDSVERSVHTKFAPDVAAVIVSKTEGLVDRAITAHYTIEQQSELPPYKPYELRGSKGAITLQSPPFDVLRRRGSHAEEVVGSRSEGQTTSIAPGK